MAYGEGGDLLTWTVLATGPGKSRAGAMGAPSLA